MSPAAEDKKASGKAAKLGGKEFEETFKPKKGASAKELEDPKSKGKKKKKKGPKPIIFIIVIVVLLGGSFAFLYLSGNLTKALSMVGLGPPQPSASVSLEEQQKALDQKAAELKAKEQTLTELQAKLDKQKAAQASAAASPSASPTFETYRAGLSAEKLAELKQVGSIYSKMDAAAAVTIMTKIYDAQQIAVIVYYMNPAAAALVLAKLEPALSASVTKLLTS